MSDRNPGMKLNTHAKLTLLSCDWTLAIDRLDNMQRKLTPAEQAERDTIARCQSELNDLIRLIPVSRQKRTHVPVKNTHQPLQNGEPRIRWYQNPYPPAT